MWSTHWSCAQELTKNFILRKSVKVFEEVFFWGCSLQPSGAILHNLVSLSKKKNSFPDVKVEKEKQSGRYHPFRPSALSSARNSQTGDIAGSKSSRHLSPQDLCWVREGPAARDKKERVKEEELRSKNRNVIIYFREVIT